MQVMEIDNSVNVLGERLTSCSTEPMTGFFRNGCCDTSAADRGSHTVCVVLTADFLAFSKTRGNDLSTPRPEFGFDGLKPGDQCRGLVSGSPVIPGLMLRDIFELRTLA